MENTLEKKKLSFVPLRDTVIFPSSVIPLNLGRQESIRAAEAALTTPEKYLVVSCQKKSEIESPKFEDVYKVGTLVRILQSLKVSDGSLKILVEGLERVEIKEYNLSLSGDYVEVSFVPLLEDKVVVNSVEVEALYRELKSEFEDYIKINKKLPQELIITIHSITDASRLSDTVASYLPSKVTDKQDILETVDIKSRLEKLIKLVIAEKEIIKLEEKLHMRVKAQIEKT